MVGLRVVVRIHVPMAEWSKALTRNESFREVGGSWVRIPLVANYLE